MSVPCFQRDWPYISFTVKEINLWRGDGSHLAALTLTRARTHACTYIRSLQKLIRPPPSHPFPPPPAQSNQIFPPRRIYVCSPVLLTPFYREKQRREDIRWEASDEGGGHSGKTEREQKLWEQHRIFLKGNGTKQRLETKETETRWQGAAGWTVASKQPVMCL